MIAPRSYIPARLPNCTWLIAFLFCLTLVGSLRGKLQDPNELARLLPGTTVCLIRVQDRPRAAAAWQQTLFAKLAQRGEFAPLANALRAATGDTQDVAREALPWLLLDLEWTEVQSVASAEVAWVAIEHKDRLARMVVIEAAADVVTSGPLVDYQNRLRADGFRASRSAVGGTELVSWVHPKSGDQRALIHHRDRLWLCDDREVLSELISSHAAKRLSEDDSFQYVDQQLRQGEAALPSDAVTWWADVRRLVAVSTQDEASKKSAQDYQASGFDAIRAAGGAVRFMVDARESIADVIVYRDRPLKRSAQMLSFKTSPIASTSNVGYIPMDGIGQAYVDWKKVIAGYASSFDRLYGDGEDGVFDLVLDEIRDERDSPHVDIRNDVFAQLRQPVTFIRATGAADYRPDAPARGFMVPVADAKRVQQAVEKMMVGDPDALKQPVPGGHVWQFRHLKREPNDPLLGPDVSGWAIGVVRGQLLVANQLRLAEALASGTKGDQDERLESVRAEADSLGIQQISAWRTFRVRSLAATLYGRLRQSEATDGTPPLAVMLQKLLPQSRPLNLSKLPAKISFPDELGWGFQLTQTLDGGWRITSFTVAP